MDVRKIVVVVEDVEVARTALEWALHNLVRHGDLMTLLHVFPTTRSRNKNKLRLRRLEGFQLALSFKDICNNFPNAKTEIIVREGDQEGCTIAAMVTEIGASALVVGLHQHSFLYKLAMGHSNIANNLNCKVLGIKQPTSLTTRTISIPDSSTNMDFSQIEITGLRSVSLMFLHQKSHTESVQTLLLSYGDQEGVGQEERELPETMRSQLHVNGSELGAFLAIVMCWAWLGYMGLATVAFNCLIQPIYT